MEVKQKCGDKSMFWQKNVPCGIIVAVLLSIRGATGIPLFNDTNVRVWQTHADTQSQHMLELQGAVSHTILGGPKLPASRETPHWS